MRTSSQLTKVEQCEFHPRANITQSSDSITRGTAQKNVLMRMLRGEPIDDISGEIDSILTGRRCMWENEEQRAGNLTLYEARIRRFYDYESTVNGPHIVFPEQIPTVVSNQSSDIHERSTVDFFGEPVEAKPDYFVIDDEHNRVIVKKIKTGRFHNEKEDTESYESYALGLLGKKLFPDKTIDVEIDHLGDPDPKSERMAINAPYMQYRKYSYLNFDETAMNYFNDKYETESADPTGCTPTDCAGCNMNSICHFEEPPISLDVVQSVRPISEIRLTHAQQQVINYEEGVARINAGAGAGKTLVVAMRIVELLKKGYEPEDICLLTFTNAGAGEMTARVVQYCAGNGIIVDPEKLTSTTFNAFCYQLVKDHYDELGFSMPPRVLPEETRSGVINRILDQYPRIEEWNYATTSAQKNIYYRQDTKIALPAAKNLFAEIKKEHYTREDNPYENEYSAVSLDLIFQMYNEFNRVLMRRNFVEFDDQIDQVFKLLDIHPSLFDELGYKHIIVDEFQDTDLPQIKLLNAINDTAAFKSFMAVGDDSQAIFSFRHTSPEYMINFEQYFGRYDDFNLVENHRSAEDIIAVANKINALNENRVEKDLIATKPAGIGPDIKGFYSQKSEYEWVAQKIKEDIESGKSTSDIAFLASTKNELTKMASILTEMGIPSILMNPIPYITNSRVAAVTTLFEAFTEGTNRGLLDYQNVLNHGALKGATSAEMEAVAMEFENEIRSQERTAARFVEYCKALDPDSQDECFQSFIEKFEGCEDLDEMAEFFRDFKMYGQDSCFKREGKYEGVCLTTVHSAKGLEWDITYLTLSKFDNERFHKGSRSLTPKQLAEKEETNRKWFVGTTRAREKLVMTGEFVTSVSKNDMHLNEYVQRGYDLLGKPYDYTAGEYWEVRQREKEADKASARNRMPSLESIRKATKEEIEHLEAGTGHANVSEAMSHDVLSVYRSQTRTNRNVFSPTEKVRTRNVAKTVSNKKAYADFCKAGSETAHILQPTENGYISNVFGREVTVQPTFLIRDGQDVTIRQLRSERNPLGDAKTSLDIAALAMVAERAFPGATVNVVIDELGPFGKNEAQALKTTSIVWNDTAKHHYEDVVNGRYQPESQNENPTGFEAISQDNTEIEFE